MPYYRIPRPWEPNWRSTAEGVDQDPRFWCPSCECDLIFGWDPLPDRGVRLAAMCRDCNKILGTYVGTLTTEERVDSPERPRGGSRR